MDLNVIIHQTDIYDDDLEGQYSLVKNAIEKLGPGLHVFPANILNLKTLNGVNFNRPLVQRFREMMEELKNIKLKKDQVIVFGETILQNNDLKILFTSNEDLDNNFENKNIIIASCMGQFAINKGEKRIARFKEISNAANTPVIFINPVNFNNGAIYDGQSFVINNGEVKVLKSFEADELSVTVKLNEDFKSVTVNSKTLKELITSELKVENNRLSIEPWTDKECEQALNSICFAISSYAKKYNFNKFLIALSGGMDSALVLAILRILLKEGQTLDTVYMPGFFSAGLSYDLSKDLCKRLGIKLNCLPIKFFHSAIKNAFQNDLKMELSGLADENIQSRLRGALLYAVSNKTGAIVLNTSNKSELGVGYSTLYGDSVGAISPLGDVYKTEVFQLARYINKKYGEIIPEGIITRPPSAELRQDQTDEGSLPPYERLDAILEAYFNNLYTAEELSNLGYDLEETKKVYRLLKYSEYKRNQFCPIVKIKPELA